MPEQPIVICGASSFVGWHLARHFHAQGIPVLALTSRPLGQYEGIYRWRLEQLAQGGVPLAVLDLLDAASIRSSVASWQPRVWIQHAGWAKDYASPNYDVVRATAINLSPLRPIYEALSTTDCQGVILTGSVSEYAESQTPLQEDDRRWPTTAYGWIKLAQTGLAVNLAAELGVRTRVARLFLPFGRADAPGKLLPCVVRALSRNLPVELSDCTQARDFIYIDDVCTAYEKLAADLTRDCDADIVNIASGEATTLRNFLEQLTRSPGWDTSLLRFGSHPRRQGEPEIQVANISRARQLLDWKPRPLARAIEHYLAEELSALETV